MNSLDTISDNTSDSSGDEFTIGLTAYPEADPSSDIECSIDHSSDNEERQYTGLFEGPEKTLEVCFRPGSGGEMGCRAFGREQLDIICQHARCTILSRISNQYLDAYVLSESSLFVYPLKIVIKTCGTTTLLRCIASILKFAASQGLELEWLGYSRKNYNFPGDQAFPHSSFDQELSFIKSHSSLCERLDGSGYVLGPVTGDHWFVYVADKCDRPSYLSTDKVINIMMFDMDESCAKMFFKSQNPTAKEMTTRSGIAALVPGAVIDDCAFEPCGYSMNAILFDSYTTVHVTPESSCSYASFETNQSLKSYTSLIKNVLSVFRPRRFVLTMWADEAGLNALQENPCSEKVYMVPTKGNYVRTAMSSTTVEGDTCCYMSNWNLESDARLKSKFRSYEKLSNLRVQSTDERNYCF